MTQDVLNFVKELNRLEPFGCENPRPKFKITTQNVEILPMKKFPQHANIKIGKLNLTYFNFLNKLVKITFSRQKSFIFEFQPRSTKGLVDDFDGGNYIIEDAYKKLNAIELNQLAINGQNEAHYHLYPKSELLNFIGGTTTTVFGTCFVTYSCFEYVEFSKEYNTQGIYHFGIYEDNEIGYNSILLSPKGVNWAKNYSKIIFLSPIIDMKYISALNAVSNAEIYVPIEKANDIRKFAGIDLSRNVYAKIFRTLTSKSGRSIYNVFELYDKCEISNYISFTTFYGALLVFNQLGLITIEFGEQIIIKPLKGVKKELTQSKIYNNLLLLKNTFKGENRNKTIKSSELIEIIEARIEEIFSLVNKDITNQGIKTRINNVILTGQGITNINKCDVAGKINLNIPVKIATGRLISTVKPTFRVAYALVRYIASRPFTKTVSSSIDTKSEEGFFKTLLERIKEFFYS